MSCKYRRFLFVPKMGEMPKEAWIRIFKMGTGEDHVHFPIQSAPMCGTEKTL
jgi:hypothetical protein